MKNKFIRITALALVLVFSALSFVSCSAANKPALTLGKNSISVGMYSLMASIFKGTLAYGNANIEKDSYWETIVNDDGETYEDICNQSLLEVAKSNLYKLALFDEKGLTLPESIIAEIDKDLEFWVDYDADGSKNNFNSMLSEYGANYDILRDYMIMAAKIDYLGQYLYDGGKKISNGVKQEYLNENYVAFKQILMPYYEYVYETDKNGDEIYYSENGSICYDPKKGEPMYSDGSDKADKDKNGDVIYYHEVDGKIRICYDTVNGNRRHKVDSKGNYVTKPFDSAEKSKVWKEGQNVFAKVENGNFNGFEALMLVYDDNFTNESGIDSMIYLNTEVDYKSIYSDGVIESLLDKTENLDIGEAALLETEYGVHIIMKYELEENAWENEKYSGYFTDSTKVFDFNSNLINKLFTKEMEKIAEKMGEVDVNKESIANINVRKSAINYNFY